MIIILTILFNTNLFSQNLAENDYMYKNAFSNYYDNISIDIKNKMVFDTNKLLLKHISVKDFFDNIYYRKKNISENMKNVYNNLDGFNIFKVFSVFGIEIYNYNLNELKPGLYYIIYQKNKIFITKKVKIE
jgi:hypothetical protein